MSNLLAVSTHGWWNDIGNDPDLMELVGTYGWFPQDISTDFGTDFIHFLSSIDTELKLLSTLM